MIRKIQYNAYGDPSVLEMVETDEPTPGEGEVRVTVKAVGLNPIDLKTFEGFKPLRVVETINRLRHPSWWFGRGPARFPKGVGRDFSGVIDALGPGVNNVAVDDAVLGTLRSAPGSGVTEGSLAEKLVTSAQNIVAKPENLNFEVAAALGVAGETACGAFRAIDLKPEDVLVISAASGGVGAVAVQLAVHRGATVIGIASEKNAEFVRSLGATPVAYGDGLKERILKAAPAPVTKMLDCYGGDYIPLGAELGLKGSAMGTLNPAPKAMIKGVQFTGARHAQPGDLKEVADLVASGDIDVTLAHVYPFKLESIRDGYKELGTGHVRGKLVVTIP